MRISSLTTLIKNKPAQFIASLAIAFLGLFAVAGLSPSTASAACGGNNDIICGGITSRKDFINNVNGSSELQSIYAYKSYNLEKSMYKDFEANAVHGYTTRSGGVYLDSGRKVGSDGRSIGRNAGLQGPGYYTQKIPGAGTYYGNYNDRAFAAGTDRLDVFILLNGDGKALFAVIISCGNPVNFTPLPPPEKPKPTPPKPTPPKASYSCDQLSAVLSNSTNNTYTFTATGSYANGATPTSATFYFGDNQTKTVAMSGRTVQTTHPYNLTDAKLRTYVAKVILKFNNGKYVTQDVPRCQARFTATIPYCSSLTSTYLDKSKYIAQFTATAVLNGRQLDSATFIFGDGSPNVTVKPNTPTTAITSHDYANGTFNAIATLRFKGSNGIYTAPNCLAMCKPNAQGCVSECKPNVPVGDVRCNPCLTNPSVPADSPECQVIPPELPNTGAGNTVAIFSAVVIGGFLIYRQVLYRRHKLAFVAAERGTSALPLADALDSETPLAGTPLATKARRSFRRKRQF